MLTLVCVSIVKVDLEGIEPSSKRGNHTLSTCLSSPSIFVDKQDRSHQPVPYPLKVSQESQGKTQAISDLAAPLDQIASEPQLLSDVPFSHLVKE